MCTFRGQTQEVSVTLKRLPPQLFFLLLLRPWYSHCLKGSLHVHLFDENGFCFLIMMFVFFLV